jgi:mRNA-degrading endonuclease toxin of MazEF toxin-antitoxin module
VVIKGTAGLQGAILADQVRSVDWRGRRIDPISRAPEVLVIEVLAKLRPLLMV